jgi:hypothetical protein
MGLHRTESSLEAIRFLLGLGEVLGYYVQDEEPMFSGDNQSPILDITWRKHKEDTYPLVIIEVETMSTKAATDNVVKLFGERSLVYPKPLFFYHVFVETPLESRRVETLRNLFGQHNYEAYSLIDPSSHLKLVTNILEQHLRVFEKVQLLQLVDEIYCAEPFQITVDQILRRLVEIGYDLRPESNFVSELETLVVADCDSGIQEFYQEYLPVFLSYENAPAQKYPPYCYEQPLFRTIHWSIILILGISFDHSKAFGMVQRCEEPKEGLWGHLLESYEFGQSMDDDERALSEWPLVFALLCLAFSETPYARYFSNKLTCMLAAAREQLGFVPIHSLLWLAISAQLAQDEESYNFAKMVVDEQGGVPIELIRCPTLYSGFPGNEDIDPDWSELSVPQEMPECGAWSNAVQGAIEAEETNVVVCLIVAFLWIGTTGSNEALRDFANFCMNKIVHR